MDEWPGDSVNIITVTHRQPLVARLVWVADQSPRPLDVTCISLARVGAGLSARGRLERLCPRNGILTQTDHVRAAVGRNYVDATPTSGTIYVGGGPETLCVDVSVTTNDVPETAGFVVGRPSGSNLGVDRRRTACLRGIFFR